MPNVLYSARFALSGIALDVTEVDAFVRKHSSHLFSLIKTNIRASKTEKLEGKIRARGS